MLIKSWLDKNADVHKPDFGTPKGVSPKGVSPQGVSPQGVSPQEEEDRKILLRAATHSSRLVPCARGLAGAFVWGIGDPFGMN